MVTNSPWARLMTFMSPKMMASPRPTIMKMLISVSAFSTRGTNVSNAGSASQFRESNSVIRSTKGKTALGAQ